MEPLLEAVATYDAAPGTGTFANAAQIALVEVDAETGSVTLLGYWVVEDCGQMINPLIVDGQVHGGVAQGIGGALLEEFVYDEDGQLQTTTFMDYLLPGSTDIPPIASPTRDAVAVHDQGHQGHGRGRLDRARPGDAAAVEDALRPIGKVFVNELPLTPSACGDSSSRRGRERSSTASGTGTRRPSARPSCHGAPIPCGGGTAMATYTSPRPESRGDTAPTSSTLSTSSASWTPPGSTPWSPAR